MKKILFGTLVLLGSLAFSSATSSTIASERENRNGWREANYHRHHHHHHHRHGKHVPQAESLRKKSW